MFKNLRLENFQSHKDSTFEFSPNLSVIVGSSNQGKSSIVRAFSLLLYNQWDSSWTRVGASFCRITLTLDSGIVVIREKGPKINKYTLQIPNQPSQIFSNFGVEVPDIIQKALNIRKIDMGKDDPLILNYASQLESLFLFNRSGSAKANVLGHLSNAHFLDHALRSLGTEKKQISTEKNLKTQELALLKDQFTALESVNTFKSKLDEFEVQNIALDAAKQRVEALKLLLRRVQEWKRRYEIEIAKESLLGAVKGIECTSMDTSVQRLKELNKLLIYNKDLLLKERILNDAKNQFEIDLKKETQTYLTTLSVNKVCPTCFEQLNEQKMSKIQDNLIGKEKCLIEKN